MTSSPGYFRRWLARINEGSAPAFSRRVGTQRAQQCNRPALPFPVAQQVGDDLAHRTVVQQPARHGRNKTAHFFGCIRDSRIANINLKPRVALRFLPPKSSGSRRETRRRFARKASSRLPARKRVGTGRERRASLGNGVWTFSVGRGPRATAGARPVAGRSACAHERAVRKHSGPSASSLPLRAGTARAAQKNHKLPRRALLGTTTPRPSNARRSAVARGDAVLAAMGW